MMNCIGTCGHCGGSVMAHTGAWMGVMPPPPPRCASCGYVGAGSTRVVRMVPPQPTERWTSGTPHPWYSAQ